VTEKEALFAFILAIAGAVVAAYLTAAVIAVVHRTRLDGCGWFALTWAVFLAVWTLLSVAGQLSGVNIPGPW
jgi:hypothetical protein